MKKNYFLLLWVLSCLFSLPQISYGQLRFTSTPVTTATVGVPYTYSSFAADGTSNTPTMTCPTKPAWLNFADSGSTSMVTFGPTIIGPGGIASDTDGNTYVVEADTNNSYIYKIAPDGTVNTTWAAVDNGVIYAMNVDGGYLYVSCFYNTAAEGSDIKKISLSNPSAGQTMVYQDIGGLLSFVFRGGFIYCANYYKGSIIKINPTTGTAVDYVTIYRPFGLGFDASGLLYIASYNDGTISTYDGVTLTTKISGLGYPSDVKIDANGNIYVSLDSGGIIKYDSTFTTKNVLVPLVSENKIFGMNLSPTGSLVFGLNTLNTCARIETGAVLSGTPSSTDIGPHNVTITAKSSTETVTQDFIVTVQGAPTITSFPDLNGTVGTNITLTDPISNSAGTFSYTSSNTAVATINSNTVTPLNSGVTTITATQTASGNYTQGTISCTLTVCTPVAITSQPSAQTTCIGSTATFTVGATGTGLTYQWKKGADTIASATTETLSLTNVSSADAANYSCVVSGTCGSVTSSAVALSMDATLPTITAPANVLANVNSSCVATGVALGTPTTADNCLVANVANDAPTAFSIGLTTVTWTVTDSAGNTATATQNVIVTDNDSPTITSPADVNATTNTACTATGVLLGTPTTTDNCSVASVTNNHPSTTYPLGDTTVIWTVTDGSGNTATANQTVTVIDTQKPTLATLSPISVNADSGICTYASSQLTAPTALDNCSVASVATPLASLVLGDNTVTWTVTDGSGNTATATQLVTVVDSQIPTIATLISIGVNADLGVCTYASSQLTAPTAADNCSVASIVVSPPSLDLGDNLVTWTVTDGAGLTATSTQIVTVLDAQNPTITIMNRIVSTNASCNATGVNLGTPTTTDNCSVASVTNNHPSTTYPLGDTTVIWTVTDGSGNTATANQIVTVTDVILPIVKTKNIIVQLDASGNATLTAAEIDNGSSDNCGISTMTLSQYAFTISDIGIKTITLTVTDNSGNTSSATAQVTIEVTLSTDAQKNNAFVIYPIPFDSHINITLPDSYTEDVIYIQLFDLTGRVIYYQKHTVENHNTIISDMKRYSDGSYYINLLDANQNLIQSKHILKKAKQ